MATTKEIRQNLVFAPGHGFTKIALGEEATPEQKQQAIFPSIIRPWPSTNAPKLDDHTYLVEVSESSNPDLHGQVRLIGEQVKNLGTDTIRTFARNSDKFSSRIAPWLAFASLSTNIPPGVKSCEIAGVVLSMLPHPDLHGDIYRQALAGKHKIRLHRKAGVVDVQLNWTNPEEQIQIFQEGAYGFYYCRAQNLFGKMYSKALYVSQDTGMNTAIVCVQDAQGEILKVRVFEDSGAVGLAENIKSDPRLRQRVGGDCDSTVLVDAFSSPDPQFVYGEGGRGIKFGDIFPSCREQWESSIDSMRNEVLSKKQRPSVAFITLLGGTSHHYEKEDPLILRLQHPHDPQRADVEGLRIYAVEKGLIND